MKEPSSGRVGIELPAVESRAMTVPRFRIRTLMIAVAVPLGLLTVAVLTSPRAGVTDENYGHITYGMTLAEVQALLGGVGEEWEPMGNTFVRTWRGDGLTIDVSFQGCQVSQRARMKDGQGWSEVPPEPFPARVLHLFAW
jgi:hypothetical protein